MEDHHSKSLNKRGKASLNNQAWIQVLPPVKDAWKLIGKPGCNFRCKDIEFHNVS